MQAIVAGAGRIDDTEFERSVETLQRVAYVFEETGIRGGVERIRSAEGSILHTVEEAIKFIEAVDSPGI